MKPSMLVILDGLGHTTSSTKNAIAAAHAPFLHKWMHSSSCHFLQASGPAVGLPAGYVGNSQVGHTTIAAGQIVKQPITLLQEAITTGALAHNTILLAHLNKLVSTGKRLHIIGLLSDGGVHSHIAHLFAFMRIAHSLGLSTIIHPILDGRDVPPRSAATYLKQLDDACALTQASIGTIHGRWYAMDRAQHWDRTEKSYLALTTPRAPEFANWQTLLEHAYANAISDEFVVPAAVNKGVEIQSGDGIIFYNVRPDRAKQLAAPFCDPHFHSFQTRTLQLSFFITPFSLEQPFSTTVLFKPTILHNSLKEVLSRAGKKMLSIAETEKYAHVTHFFGGHSDPWPEETQIALPSYPDKQASDHPCMKAPEITNFVLEALKKNEYDFYLINYANADMVGHSGNFAATVAAIECLDAQLQKLYTATVEQLGGMIFIVGDHGKAEDMYDEKNKAPRTAHTANPVPFIALGTDNSCLATRPLIQLCDVAPFILCQLGLPIPNKMQN